MPLELILSQKHRPLLIHENYVYNIHRVAEDKVIWRCEEYKNRCTIRCHTTSKKPGGRILFMTPGDHNHLPDIADIEARKVVNLIRTKARTTKERAGLIVANAVEAASSAAVASLPDIKCLIHTVQRTRKKKLQNSKIKDSDPSSSSSPSPEASAAPRLPTLTTPRPRRTLTAGERASRRFAALEQRRLLLEETRERNTHERETERLRLEMQRIEVLRRATEVGEALLGHLTSGRDSK